MLVLPRLDFVIGPGILSLALAFCQSWCEVDHFLLVYPLFRLLSVYLSSITHKLPMRQAATFNVDVATFVTVVLAFSNSERTDFDTSTAGENYHHIGALPFQVFEIASVVDFFFFFCELPAGEPCSALRLSGDASS